MGLIGKSFTSKLKNITLLAISRIAILKNRGKARASYAHYDVSQLLKLGYHDQALVRVEHWIVEQNMLDAFVMIEEYCNVLREKAHVLENNKECPIDLKEATCSLIFASSRCGNFPELHKVQEIMTSKFGKEFADHSIKLHKNNGVNTKMIQKLSSRYITMEIKMNAMKKIASEIGVTLLIEKDTTLTNKEKLNADQGQNKLETKNHSSVESVDDVKHEEEDTQHDPNQNVIQDKNLFDVNEEKRRNKNAAEAVLQALELATFEMSKYSNHKQKGVIISKRNYSIDLKEESQKCQNPRDDMITQENATILVSKENANRESDTVGELSSHKSLKDDDDNDHKSEFDEGRENEDLSEEKTYTSSQAIRWNPHRSQSNVDVNFMVRHVKKTYTHHEHLDWKMMSVRTR